MNDSSREPAKFALMVYCDDSLVSAQRAISEVWSGVQPATTFKVELRPALPQDSAYLNSRELDDSNP